MITSSNSGNGVMRDIVPIPPRPGQQRAQQHNSSARTVSSDSSSASDYADPDADADAAAAFSPSLHHPHASASAPAPSTPLSASSSSASTSSLAASPAVDARSSSSHSTAAAPLPFFAPLMKFENGHPLPMQLCGEHSVQRGALLAVYTQGKNYAQLYTLDAVGKRGVSCIASPAAAHAHTQTFIVAAANHCRLTRMVVCPCVRAAAGVGPHAAVG